MFQSHYLVSMGMNVRVEKLLKESKSSDNTIQSSAKRLIDPTGMGAQYKVMGVESRGGVSEGSKDVAEEQRVYPFDYEAQLRGGGGKE